MLSQATPATDTLAPDFRPRKFRQRVPGTNNDDFTHNIVRFVGEERLALAVKRPAAVLSLTAADQLGASDMKIKVLQPFQVCHDGKIYRPGDTADVPDAVAKA